ncbi:unnamed protein product [Citrullus colocynthis]|uniref:NADH-plastoquinone oxidoreductase subunit K n=1 Tax=Citrullus colocynthis TaxID=252529 RepID=A0ABP0Y2F2_9ROSI
MEIFSLKNVEMGAKISVISAVPISNSVFFDRNVIRMSSSSRIAMQQQPFDISAKGKRTESYTPARLSGEQMV